MATKFEKKNVKIKWEISSIFAGLKLRFSETATKFEKKFVVLLTRASCSVRAIAYLSKIRRRFFKINVVKLYYTNINDKMQLSNWKNTISNSCQ